MTLDAYGWPALSDAAMAKRRKWLGRAGVLWGQMNWIACKLEAPVGPPTRLAQKEDDEPETWIPEDDETLDPARCIRCGEMLTTENEPHDHQLCGYCNYVSDKERDR